MINSLISVPEGSSGRVCGFYRTVSKGLRIFTEAIQSGVFHEPFLKCDICRRLLEMVLFEKNYQEDKYERQ